MKDLEKLFSRKADTPGKIIQSFRHNFKISQAELCAITGINEKYLSALENDRRPIGVEVAAKIAVFFNFDPSLLLFPDGLEGLRVQYADIQKRAKKLISEKRKSA